MELDPNFKFDLGGAEDAHPWEFTSALRNAKAPDPRSTTLDEKIVRQLAWKQQREEDTRASKRGTKRAREEAEASSSDEDDDDDEPLPGEDCDDDDDEDEDGEGLGARSDGESESEDEGEPDEADTDSDASGDARPGAVRTLRRSLALVKRHRDATTGESKGDTADDAASDDGSDKAAESAGSEEQDLDDAAAIRTLRRSLAMVKRSRHQGADSDEGDGGGSDGDALNGAGDSNGGKEKPRGSGERSLKRSLAMLRRDAGSSSDGSGDDGNTGDRGGAGGAKEGSAKRCLKRSLAMVQRHERGEEDEDDGGSGGEGTDERPSATQRALKRSLAMVRREARSEEDDDHDDDDDDDGDVGSSDDDEDSAGNVAAAAASERSRKAARRSGALDGDEEEHGGQGGFYCAVPEDTSYTAKSFADLNLSRPLVKACTALGYTTPTPIQAACVPLAMLGRDIVGSAQTGSGKTAAFALPLLERLLFRQKRVGATYVLILTPTRELAAQIHSMICKLAQFTDIRAALVVGGLSMQRQAAELRTSPEIVVATPGRIIDHVLNTMSFELDSLSALVLDEADRLLELGFMEEIKQLVKLSPRKRQTLLFSATMTDEVQKLITVSLTSPVRLAADARATAPSALRQEVVRLKGAAAADKDAVLFALISRSLAKKRTIVFCAQKWKVHQLKILMGLAQLPAASELHGDLTQAARLESLEAFRTGAATVLLATDVAARGLDILGVEVVVNYDAPRTLETYLHRIGRTARAGASGLAISLVLDADRALLKGVVKEVKARLSSRVVPKDVIASWRRKVEALAPDLQDVLQDERQEKALRKAEMEATKAENLMLHEAEIMSRPKREWFMSEKEKKRIAAAAATSTADDADASNGNRSGKAAKAARNAEAKGANKDNKREAPPHVRETRAEMGPAKAAKSAARKLREAGQKPKESAKAALTAIGAKKSVKQKKKKKQKVDHAQGDEGPGERAPRNSHVYEGGGKSGSVTRQQSGPSKAEKARMSRGGKGRAQFKGKARYKRR